MPISLSNDKTDIPSNKVFKQNIQDMNIPVLLILKRQAIRVFPDGTRIGLYYADKIKKHITIPFINIGVNEATGKELEDKMIKDTNDFKARTPGQNNKGPDTRPRKLIDLSSRIKQSTGKFYDKIHKEVEDTNRYRKVNEAVALSKTKIFKRKQQNDRIANNPKIKSVLKIYGKRKEE